MGFKTKRIVLPEPRVQSARFSSLFIDDSYEKSSGSTSKETFNDESPLIVCVVTYLWSVNFKRLTVNRCLWKIPIKRYEFTFLIDYLAPIHKGKFFQFGVREPFTAISRRKEKGNWKAESSISVNGVSYPCSMFDSLPLWTRGKFKPRNKLNRTRATELTRIADSARLNQNKFYSRVIDPQNEPL